MTDVSDPQMGELSNDQVDALVAGSEQPLNQEMAMDAPAPVEQTPTSDMFNFKADGKDIEADREKMIKYAQQGYNYAQRMQGLNQDRQRFLEDQKRAEQEFGVYKQFDAFAKQHPQWWDQQLNTFKQGEPPQAASPEVDGNKKLSPEVEALQTRLGEYESKLNGLLADKQMQERQQEDSQLETEIKSIREEHSDLDWSSVDAEGKNLELRVLQHARDTGINNYRAAFRDFNHDKLLELAKDRGKEDLSKDLQKRTKLGILGETPEPLKRVQTPLDPRNFTYDDLEEQARQELGLKEQGAL